MLTYKLDRNIWNYNGWSHGKNLTASFIKIILNVRFDEYLHFFIIFNNILALNNE